MKSVVGVALERIEPFSPILMRLLGKFTKDHIHASPATPGYDVNDVRLVMTILDICQILVAFLGDQCRWLLSTLCVLVDKSKSLPLCRYMLDLARSWALQEAYLTMKEKATLLQKMALFEWKPRWSNFCTIPRTHSRNLHRLFLAAQRFDQPSRAIVFVGLSC